MKKKSKPSFEYVREDGMVRLRALRQYTKKTQVDFAKWTGIPYKKWNHYERGYAVPRDAAFILLRKFEGHLSLEWIWFGMPDAVEKSLLAKLDRLVEEEQRQPPDYIPRRSRDKRKQKGVTP